MIQTIEAVVDESGRVRLLGEVRVDGPRRALLTVLEEPAVAPGEAALLAEAALAADWSRPEEDAAWSLAQEAAEALLRLRFERRDLDRLNDLVSKNQDDALTEAEKAELEHYLRISSFLDLMHAKARRSLKHRG